MGQRPPVLQIKRQIHGGYCFHFSWKRKLGQREKRRNPYHGYRIWPGCTCESGSKVQCRGYWLRHTSAPSAGFLYRRWQCTLSTPTRGTSHRHCPRLATAKPHIPNPEPFLMKKSWRRQKQSEHSRRHTGQHSPSTKEGLAQATGGHVIWWHTILDSCHEEISLALSSTFELNLHICRGTTWQVHLVQLSTIQSSLSSNRRPSCQHMFFSLEFFILPRASFIRVFSSV